MHHRVLVDLLSRISRHRQAAQELVEFSLALVAVGFVGMVGLHVLGGAEATILGGQDAPASQLNPPPPPPGYFNHRTSTTVACNGTSYLADQVTPIHCVATVQDIDGAPQNPDGHVNWYLDNQPMPSSYSCNPVLVQLGSDRATCALNYVPTHADSLPPHHHTLYAAYDPTSSHAPSFSQPPTMFDVYPAIASAINCSSGTTTQYGVPIMCGVHLTDLSDGSNDSNDTATLTATTVSGAGGLSYFSCWTNNQPNELADPSKCPNPSGSSWPCTTDGSGMCWFTYRMTYFEAQASAPAGSTTVQISTSQPGAPLVITVNPVNPNLGLHDSGVLIHCAPPAGTSTSPPKFTAVRTWGSGVYSDADITSHLGQDVNVNCTVVVVDKSVNPATFDIGCGSGCNVDRVEATPPWGSVTITIFDKNRCGNNPCNPATDTFATVPCTLGHMAMIPPVPWSVYPSFPVQGTNFFPNQPTGQFWNPTNPSASWCSPLLHFPVESVTAPGHYVVRASYNGWTHAPSSAGQSFASQDLTINAFAR